MRDTARRVIVITLLSGASVFFAARFHRPVPEPLLTAQPFETAPTSTTTTPWTPATTTTSTTTLPPTTTIPLPEGDVAGAMTFEGTRIYTNWGWVKVEIAVLDGVMVDVEMVMIPRATKRSEALTAEHEPTLREEALTTQSPEVPLITGATNISYGYRASLAGAMREAGLWPRPES